MCLPSMSSRSLPSRTLSSSLLSRALPCSLLSYSLLSCSLLYSSLLSCSILSGLLALPSAASAQDIVPRPARIERGQGQLYSERLPTGSQVEYMAWPRLLALSETLWTPRALKDFRQFEQRLPEALLRLDAQDVNYRTANGPRWPATWPPQAQH